MEERLLKGKEVAEKLGVSSSFAYLLMKRGDIPTVRMGTAVRVRLEDLEHYIRENTMSNRSKSSHVIHSS